MRRPVAAVKVPTTRYFRKLRLDCVVIVALACLKDQGMDTVLGEFLSEEEPGKPASSNQDILAGKIHFCGGNKHSGPS